MLLSWWCPLGHCKRHLPAIQIFIAVRLIPILTHLSSRWTVPLNHILILLFYTGGKFATGINDTGGKFCHQFRWCCWHRRKICHRCQWYLQQIMETISGCRHLKVILKAKLSIYVNSSTQGFQTKELKFFWLKICSLCTLNCEYLREFSKKFETVLMVYSGVWSKLIHEKKQNSKISRHCPINMSEIYILSVCFTVLMFTQGQRWVSFMVYSYATHHP